MVLLRGLHYREEDAAATNEMTVQVQRLFNEYLFGDVDCPSNWIFPIEDGILGEVKFANWRVRHIINEFNRLVDICIPQHDEKQQWKETVQRYRDVFSALHVRHTYSPEEIDEFQNKADSFFAAWLSLVGYDGITNYIHMIGAGHIRYYLRRWGNLFRLQNQGWESYNQMIESFWHRRTQKGGNSPLGKSKIRPIARWIARLIMWRTGEGERFFTSNNKLDNADTDSEDDDNGFDGYAMEL